MARRWVWMRAIAVVAGLVLACCATASADPSAWPFKAAGDSGVISTYDWDFDDQADEEGDWATGFDACTYTHQFNNADMSFQQYTIPGCVPVMTPWIQMTKWLKPYGWKLYCPSSAPYFWGGLGDGAPTGAGALQMWRTADQEVKYEPNPANTDWYHPGTSDHAAFLPVPFTSHHWLFVIGCGGAYPGTDVPYCCGQGPSARVGPSLADDPATPPPDPVTPAPPTPDPVTPTPAPAPIPAPTPPAPVDPVDPAPGHHGPPSAQAAARLAPEDRPNPHQVKGPPQHVRWVSPYRYEMTQEHDLRPGARATFRIRCKPGFRAERKRYGIGWYTASAPDARDGTVRDRQRHVRRGYAVTVEASDGVRPGQVRLQMQLHCERR